MEPGIGWERGEGWLKIVALTEAARRRDWSEWTPERRERIFQRVLAGVEMKRQRRRSLRAFAAGAVTVVLVGLLLRLIGVDVVALAFARG